MRGSRGSWGEWHRPGRRIVDRRHPGTVRWCTACDGRLVRGRGAGPPEVAAGDPGEGSDAPGEPHPSGEQGARGPGGRTCAGTRRSGWLQRSMRPLSPTTASIHGPPSPTTPSAPPTWGTALRAEQRQRRARHPRPLRQGSGHRAPRGPTDDAATEPEHGSPEASPAGRPDIPRRCRPADDNDGAAAGHEPLSPTC